MISIFEPFDGQHIDQDSYEKLLRYFKLNITDKYEFPPEIIKINGTTIATVGNFSASTGKPKSKKTFNISALVASALSGKPVLCYTAELPPKKKRVLYIDTEQSKCHCHKVLERILKLAGLPTDRDCEKLDFFVLREYTPDQRRDIINCALNENHDYGLVVIDGIRDLIRDINSPSESLDIINDLMRWSSYYELHIHTVLHQNKSDENTRGHIGTELNNKAETVLLVRKSPENNNISEVRAMHIRDKEFKPFAFQIDDDGLPELVDAHEFKPTKQERICPLTELPDNIHRQALDIAFSETEQAGYNQLMSILHTGYEQIGYIRGRNTLIELIKYHVRRGILIKRDKNYVYNREFFTQKQV